MSRELDAAKVARPDLNERYSLVIEISTQPTWEFTVPGLRENLEEAIEEIDDLCKKKRHPLSYYKSKWIQEKNIK